AFDEMHRIGDSLIRRIAGAAEVVERAQHVVMVARWKCQLEKLRIHNLAGRQPPHQSPLQKIFLASPSGRCNPRPRPNRPLILEQTLQDANRGMKRRAHALRSIAVPTAVFQLLTNKTARKALRGTPKVSAQRKRSTVDARFYFALEKRLRAKFLVPTETTLQ